MSARVSCFVSVIFSLLCAGCANITAPTGGKKDKTPPKLVSVEPRDSLTDTKIARIEMYFDEYITVSDVSKEVQMSPILSIAPSVKGLNKHVVVKIIDSLLEENTTYRLSFGKAIKDLHEGNVFARYTYTFSTGAYFDSLQLHGAVSDAATGLPGMDGVVVALYSAKDNDSAVVRRKPKYIATPDATGNFTFKGLPKRAFRIYAIKDANNNLIYDGPGAGEQIGFADNVVIPADTGQGAINLRVFAEIPDTAAKKSIDSLSANKKERMGTGAKSKPTVGGGMSYSVHVDSSNAEKRTFDINEPVTVSFSYAPALNNDKISLSYDSLGITLTPQLSIDIDPAKKIMRISPKNRWSENKVYTLRLAKGFAKDTAGADFPPSRYTFRTMSEEDDYGKLTMRLPSKYLGSTYLFRVMSDGDSLYQKPVTDTTVLLRRLKPGKYTFRIIVDKNHNGKWDTGDLFGKIQPEEVISYREEIKVKAGFEYDQPFEERQKTLKGSKDKGK